MGFLDKAIRRGVGDALNKAVGGAVRDAASRFAGKVVDQYADQAAAQIGQARASAAQQIGQSMPPQNIQQSVPQQSVPQQSMPQQSMPQQSMPQQNTQWGAPQMGGLAGLTGTLGQLQRSLEGYANEAAKNMKTCPACGEVATADKQFCPSCGARLPEQTLAQGAVCTACGRPNSIGTRFCQGCGAKLPFAVAEERAAAEKDAAALAQWDRLLAGFPRWTLGGGEFAFDAGQGYTMFSATFANAAAAQYAVEQYRAILRQNGFREAGQYPDKAHLYRKVGGYCYHVDTEHCFEGDSETADIYFMYDEPSGGFDYVKPQRRSSSLFDLFK